MTTEQRTILYERHLELGAQMVPFGGWQMPVQYKDGIIQEHLATRRRAGLFDVSHMGRFIISGSGALAFLQHALTNNAEALQPGQSQYTLLADPGGGAVDDAYLYRFFEDSYLLVVNAANRLKDWEHFQSILPAFPDTSLVDRTDDIAMISLQGPQSKTILADLLGDGALPAPERNALSIARRDGIDLWLGRTGYTGEPLCFEIFLPSEAAVTLWNRLMAAGAQPVGLGARDTLRLEAALPLYGHELGLDSDGRPIPIFAISLARFAVSFSPLKGDFIGRAALEEQFRARRAIQQGRFDAIDALPRMVRPVALLDKGVARAGAEVLFEGLPAGRVTSGTVVPYWRFEGRGIHAVMTDEVDRRAVALALIDSRIPDGAEIRIDVRGKQLRAGVMPYLLRSEAPPYARAITWQDYQAGPHSAVAGSRGASAPAGASGGLSAFETAAALAAEARRWARRAVDNTLWRRSRCINLIPSESTPSPLVRLLSIMDPAGRYAEHKSVKAFAEAEVFYYQGTDFIEAVEEELKHQMRAFLGCRQMEARPVSGQMANTVVYSGMLDFLNRADRKVEQRRMRCVMNHHIMSGGHLSAQPMGALRDYVMRDRQTERPAIVNLPAKPDNPFAVDVDACAELIARREPELIILGKSMILQKEPVAELRRIIDALESHTVLMYDMAHVLGLAGPAFQEPFAEGAHIVTGSTHKTFFGTQRGIVAADFQQEDDLGRELWEAIERRAFPGAVSNHHLGTMLGLLAAALEMNAYKDVYGRQVVANAKAFARALRAAGLRPAGDESIGFTETHQVIVRVGYGRGPQIARMLEENNIICNYQAVPEEEGFTASGALRLGVQEMTRFGMREEDFEDLAQLMADAILHGRRVADEAAAMRARFLEMQYCFGGDDFEDLLKQLHAAVH